MPRTTVDIDAPILKEVKALQKKVGLPMGRVVSKLLAEALKNEEVGKRPRRFRWTSRAMQALLDLTDKEAVHAVMDRDEK